MTTEFNIDDFITDESQRETAEKLLATFREMNATYHREQTLRGMRKARRAGRVGGARCKLDNAQQHELKEMVATASIEEIGDRFNISRPTVYSYIRRASHPKR